MARNKRLHVELTLIKLNFLQQAIELSMENGSVVKKKRIDGPIAFKTKSVTPIQFQAPAAKTPEAKLYIEQKPVAPPAAARQTPPPPQPAYQPAVAATVTAPPPVRNAPKPAASSNGVKKSLLDVLREKAGDRYAVEEIKEAEILTMEKLRACWDEYAATLEKQQKHSSAGTFKTARLVIEDEIRFTVTVSNLLSQNFVATEKMMLMDHLQTTFNNRAIIFDVLVEASEREDIPLHMRLNSKDKFEHIASQFPLVKELKERLKLEIDY
jgi:DNA polymerase-3 subunit gamma/tau